MAKTIKTYDACNQYLNMVTGNSSLATGCSYLIWAVDHLNER